MTSYFVSILLLFAFFFAGIFSARIEAVRRSRTLERLSSFLLPLMLLAMGFRIGYTTDSGKDLAASGYVAVVFALCTIAGTFATTGALCLASPRRPQNSGERRKDGPASFRGPLLLLLMVVIGFTAGALLPNTGFSGENLTTWLLRFLLFTIGIDMVRSGVSFLSALKDRNTLLLPLLTAAGSLAGGLAAALILGMNIWKGLSVASGFGWYTLSGVLITDMGDPMLGSVAFLTNMLREALAILVIPFLGPTIFSRTAVGIAGATSMDITLPLIERAAGAEMVPLSISHGVFMSLLVPFLVPLFYGAG